MEIAKERTKRLFVEHDAPPAPFAADDEPQDTILIDPFHERIQSGVSTNVGRRKNQQDAAAVERCYGSQDNYRMIAVLCDGMGGLAGGEVAGKLCAETLAKDFQSADVSEDVVGFFRTAVHKLDGMVGGLKDEDDNPLNAGTTLASVIIVDDKLYWASVGDSRIYLIRNNEIAQITIDHNYGMILDQNVKKGLISREESDSHPKREALVSYIGMGGVKYIDFNAIAFSLKSGDYIIICSDGLYRSLGADEMKNIVVNSQVNITGTAKALTNRAIFKNKINQDNTTVILMNII